MSDGAQSHTPSLIRPESIHGWSRNSKDLLSTSLTLELLFEHFVACPRFFLAPVEDRSAERRVRQVTVIGFGRSRMATSR
jgi:hypothetical protein